MDRPDQGEVRTGLPAGGRPIRTFGPAESRTRTRLLTVDHEQLIRRGFGSPDLTLAASKLPHAGIVVGQGKGLEPLGLGIEAQDRVCPPVADPNSVGVVNLDR